EKYTALRLLILKSLIKFFAYINEPDLTNKQTRKSVSNEDSRIEKTYYSLKKNGYSASNSPSLRKSLNFESIPVRSTSIRGTHSCILVSDLLQFFREMTSYSNRKTKNAQLIIEMCERKD
ncbi:hypothetical protein L9F63_022950, partial [Diploptera punctata]